MSFGTAPAIDRSRFPADEWRLVEARFDGSDLGVTETLFSVGNGYLGMRGNVPEGRPAHAHGTFINGFHETWPIKHAEEAYGFARVGQTIVNVPDAKTIRLYVDDEPLLITVAEMEAYQRSLDLRDGVDRRDLIWRTPSGKRVRVRTERMVSFVERHLAVMTFEVTLLDAAAPVVISSQILNRQDGKDEYEVPAAALGEGFDPRKSESFSERVLVPQHQFTDDARAALGYRCANSGMTLAVAAEHTLATENPWRVSTQLDGDLARHDFVVTAEAGVPIHLTKLVSYHSSRGVPARELADRCWRTLERSGAAGVDAAIAGQRAWLDEFWARSDVQVPGHPAEQQAIRWNLFQLAAAAARAEGNGIAAKGLTGSGYSGHYFWDTEIYVLPFFSYTSPRIARNALRFRHQMLDAARRRARDLAVSGALYPWRTINGEEASAYYAAGTAQYHIDADIAYALVQYVRATGDVDFMVREGVDILVETARMWADLGFWRSDGTFHIHGVTGPDEYTTVVNDNLFTNLQARFNLRAAARAVRHLEEQYAEEYDAAVARLNLTFDEVTAWEHAAERMGIPFNDQLGIHPQDAGFLDREIWDLAHTPASKRPLLLHYHPLVIYRHQVLKQADVVLGMFLQGSEFTPEQKLANFEYYDPLTTGDSTLSGVVQAIIAAEVGYQDLALTHFENSLFVDLANLHHNTADGAHIASAGGTWAALVNGFAGLRDHHGMITLDPRLPVTWEELTFHLTVSDTLLRITVRCDELQVLVLDGSGAELTVRGTAVKALPGRPVTVPLAGQGPVISGRPRLRELSGNRREDGTIIGMTVPGTTDEKAPSAEQ